MRWGLTKNQHHGALQNWTTGSCVSKNHACVQQMASRVVREAHSDAENYFTAVELSIHGWDRQTNPQNFKTDGKAIPILFSSKGSGVFDSLMQWSHTVLIWRQFLQETTKNGTATRAQMVSLGSGAGHAYNPHALWKKTTKLLQDSPSRPGSYFFICTEYQHSVQAYIH